MSLNEFSILDISNSIHSRKLSHYYCFLPTFSFLFSCAPCVWWITPRAVLHSPLQPPYPQKSSSPADFTSEISPVPVSPQFLPTITALVQANLSSGYVNSLLTGLTVSQFFQSICLTITKVLLSKYDHIVFNAARPSLTFPTCKINANGWSWHVRLFIAWAIHPFSLAPSHLAISCLQDLFLECSDPLSLGGQVWS